MIEEDIQLKVQIVGLEELSKKLEEMNEHVKRAISCADEIAQVKFYMNLEP